MIGSLSSSSGGLEAARSAQTSSLQRLSSGSRINSAKDDPAGLAIAVALASQLGGTQQASRNVYDGLSLTDTAGGALSQASDSLQRIRELTVQAANGSNNASDLQAIQEEINQLGQGLNDIASNTEFNGQKLLDGNFSTTLQTGANAGDTQTVTLSSASSQGLGVNGLDVTTPAGAANALTSLDTAISRVNSQQASIGAVQASLNSQLANLSSTYENLAASRSRINDTDYAQESSRLAQANVQNQASVQALAVYNAVQSNALDLIR